MVFGLNTGNPLVKELRKLMKESGLSQTVLAKKLGTHNSLISDAIHLREHRLKDDWVKKSIEILKND